MDVDDAAGQVELADGVADGPRRLADGRVVEQVLGPAELPEPAALDHPRRQRQVLLAPGLAVELDQRHLRLRMAFQQVLALAHDQVGEPRGHVEDIAPSGGAGVRDPRLDQVPEAVQLVAVIELAEALLRRAVGVQIAVRSLGGG